MKKNLNLKAACVFIFALLAQVNNVQAHCQMPCGIYHDDMVFDLIDQYVETMIKAVSVLKNSKFETVREKNEFIRWVCEKEKESNDAAKLITTFFLQQKIKPGEADTAKRVESAHKLLCMLVSIKQNTDVKLVEDFGDEWEKFKLMFHVEAYECKIEQIKMKKRQELLKQKGQAHDHDHDHDHEGHDHHH
jgi:nickel superoxide dismutase